MRNRTFRRLIVVGCLGLMLIPALAGAEVKLPAIFGDHMVLQSGGKVHVWGKADPGEKVQVALAGVTKSAKADGQGNWSVYLRAPKGGQAYEMTISGASTSRTLTDILVGEVWVCSGQSNMEWPTKAVKNADQELAQADHPDIRLFLVKKNVADTPQTDVVGEWKVCSAESVKDFSAVGYFFGRAIRNGAKVPVGLIESAWGGTPAESWTTIETLKSMPELADIPAAWEAGMKTYPERKAEYDTKFAEWQAVAEKAKAEGKEVPKQPAGKPQGADSPWKPAGLYNAMIAPITPFTVRGAIWYQGESNADRAYQYRTLFPAMIKDWRKMWHNRKMPFAFVQLANYWNSHEKPAEPAPSMWAELREAQTMTLSLPKTGMAVIADIGESKDIHPKNKQDVGARLSLWALAKVYRLEDVGEYSGPMYDEMEVEDGEIEIEFKHGEGLVAKGGTLKGFEIAGADQKFVWADAKLDGDEVVVSSPSVAKPVAVRYAWSDDPEVTLFNAAGLPASPFRTDTWPGVTVNNKRK